MEQWIDIVTKGAECTSGTYPIPVKLKFEAVNNTPYLFTIKKIETRVSFLTPDWKTYSVAANAMVPPNKAKKSYPFYVEVLIPQNRSTEFLGGTLISINGDVTFEDCLKRTRVNSFGGLYKFGPSLFEYLQPLGMVPEETRDV